MTKGIFYADDGGTLQGRGYDWGNHHGNVTTIFGYNYNNGDSSYQTIAGRKARFSNRVPCVRIYGGTPGQTTFNISSNVAVEKRACYSFDGDPAGMKAGNYTSKMTTWLNNIPAGWTIFWVYRHEMNLHTNTYDATNFPAAYHQMRIALNNANLADGVQVFITCNFSSYQMDSFNQAWVPSTADCDIMTFDCYGNPGSPGVSTSTANKYGPTSAEGGSGVLGKSYDDTYPIVSTRLSASFQAIETAGYADSWGLLEINAPLRNWDADEQGRAKWQQDYIDLCLKPPMTGKVAPKIMLLWEAPSGNNWNQAYGYNNHGGAAGANEGSNGVFYSNPANSPMWDVWSPYITGTPKGG